MKKTTADHVPPKVLLARPFPANLITVPACHDCNRGFQRDDDYTASVAPLDIRAWRNRVAVSRLDSLLRALERPEAAGFAAYLASQRSDSRVLAANGQPLGTVIELDRKRIDRTAEHIVRGLFFHEAKKPVSKTATIRVAGKPGLAPDDEVLAHFARMWATWPERRQGEVGKGFSYVAASGFGHSIWFVMLYEYLCWIVTITEEGLPASLATGSRV